MNKDFVDFYEVLELSPNANSETVERVFRYLAKKIHPDACPNKDAKRFKRLVEAFDVIRNPELRAAYDIEWETQKRENVKIVQGANEAESDCAERARLLSVFYATRRQNMKQPGVSVGRLEDITQCPSEVLEFHLWYFKKKGWIEREESGLMSITAAGVDRIEQTHVSHTQMPFPRIEHHAVQSNGQQKQLLSV